jgi:hypothetical protein
VPVPPLLLLLQEQTAACKCASTARAALQMLQAPTFAWSGVFRY